jgi:hypothetical protein
VGLFSKNPAPPTPTSIPPSPGEHRAASDTVVRLLRVYGDVLFETAPLGARERVQACDDWAEHVRAAIPDDAGTARVDWTGLLRFFSHQRQSESEAVAHGQAQLRDTIRALSRDLQECSRTTQQNDSQVALAATRVEQIEEAGRNDAHFIDREIRRPRKHLTT